MVNPSSYFEWLKISGKQAFVVLVISSVLLFGDDSLIQKLGLIEAREALKVWIGIFWLLSFSIAVSEIIYPIYKWISQKIEFRISLKTLQKKLHQLTPDEKEFLSGYIINDTKTQSAVYSNGTVNGLIGQKIVYRASQMAHYYTTFPYNIQPWAWEYLKEHPECLQ